MWYISNAQEESLAVGKRFIFSASAWSSAPPTVLYRLLSDGPSWPEWSPIGSFHLEQEGEEGAESLGAIRVFKTSFVRSREEIVGLNPNVMFSYVALAGLPIRAHRADVELEERDGGTTIRWREDFEPKVPGTGWFLRWFLRRFIRRCADGLAAHAAGIAVAASPERPN